MSSRNSEKAPAPTKHENVSSTLEEAIRRRAYELYEQRGREDGHDTEDWPRAEEEITHSRTRSVAA
jgi:Protein of unknown function (DUF2934)